MPFRFFFFSCSCWFRPSNRAPDQPLIAVIVEDEGFVPLLVVFRGGYQWPLADDGLVSNHFSIEPTGNMGLDEGTY